MATNCDRQVAIWDTSAINKLAFRGDRSALIAGMRMTHDHWIPFDVFVEIAATPDGAKRQTLIDACLTLKGDTGEIPPSSSLMMQAAVYLFDETGGVDRKMLLESQPENHRAISIGRVFDDDLARAQKPETSLRLRCWEDFFEQTKGIYRQHFQPVPNSSNTLEEFIAKCRSESLIQHNVRDFYSRVCGRTVDADSDLADRLAKAFPPIEAVFYAFAIAHYYRNEGPPPKKGKYAGALDLLAAAYLPDCQLFVSDDEDQQRVLREVAECCRTQTEVVWFENYVDGFSIPS